MRGAKAVIITGEGSDMRSHFARLERERERERER